MRPTATVMGHQEERLAQLPAGQCFAQWRPGVDCPNAYTHVIETVGRAGYMKVCDSHREGFLRLGYTDVRVWTRDEWERSGREQVLDQAIHEAEAPQ